MYHLNITEQEMMERGGVLDKLMDNAFDAAIVVDRNGNIVHASEGSYELTKHSKTDLPGTPIHIVDPQSPFAEVLETGKAVFGLMIVVNGRKCMTNILPIISDGAIIGALGMVLFQNMANLKKILSSLNQHVENARGQRNIYDMLSRVDSSYTFDDYIGESDQVKEMLSYCRKVAKTVYPILITGETGTGKEILANAFHSFTMTDTFTPFVKINCTAIPKELLESELFGYEKGAFTGAMSAKKGKFEIANGGTILLDEIGDMDLAMQSKLLRVIEEREYERIGGNTLLPLNARIIASTNHDLKQGIKDGSFRTDLYYRLNTVEINVLPLRDRRDDIPLLIDHFLKKNSMSISFSPKGMELFKRYDWPGNVRELRNLIDRFCLREQAGTFGEDAVRQLLGLPADKADQAAAGGSFSMEENEKTCILTALKESEYNFSKAAKQLGISRSTLYSKVRKYELSLTKEIREQ